MYHVLCCSTYHKVPHVPHIVFRWRQTYLNTVSTDIGMNLPGRHPDSFARLQSVRVILSFVWGVLTMMMMTELTCVTEEGKLPNSLYHPGKQRRAPRKLTPPLLLSFSLLPLPLSLHFLPLLPPLSHLPPYPPSSWSLLLESAWLPDCSDGN